MAMAATPASAIVVKVLRFMMLALVPVCIRAFSAQFTSLLGSAAA